MLFCRGCQAKNQPLNIFVHELLERRRHLLLGEMWASADGGPPEVTLETSMGPFTVEVVLLLLLLTTGNDTRLRFGLWCRFFGLCSADVLQARSQDLQELCGALPQRLLRRRQIPPDYQGFCSWFNFFFRLKKIRFFFCNFYCFRIGFYCARWWSDRDWERWGIHLRVSICTNLSQLYLQVLILILFGNWVRI